MNLYKERDRICREIGDIDSLSVISRQPGVDSRSRGGMEGAIKWWYGRDNKNNTKNKGKYAEN